MTIFDELDARRRRIDDENLRNAYDVSISLLRDAGIRDHEDLRRVLVSPESAAQRVTAIWAVGELDMRDAIPFLWSALTDDADMAFEAAKAILKMVPDEPETFDRFMNTLGTARLPVRTRTAAAHALGIIGSPRAAEELVRILADPLEDRTLRSHCAEALGSLRMTSSLPALLRTLRDPDPELRFWSAYALGEIADPRAYEGLREALRDQGVVPGLGSVATEAAKALQQIGSPFRS